MKYYPSYLPLPLVDYSFSNDNRTVRTNFESGRISQRSLATGQRDFVKVVFQYNFSQLGIWESFVQSTLSNGALEFTIDLPDPITQTITPTVVLLDSGKYETTAVSGKLVWKVAASLIKQDKTTYTESQLDQLEANHNSGCNYSVIVNVLNGVNAMSFTVFNFGTNALTITAFDGLGTVAGLPVTINPSFNTSFTVTDPQLEIAESFTITTTQCGESDDILIPTWTA